MNPSKPAGIRLDWLIWSDCQNQHTRKSPSVSWMPKVLRRHVMHAHLSYPEQRWCSEVPCDGRWVPHRTEECEGQYLIATACHHVSYIQPSTGFLFFSFLNRVKHFRESWPSSESFFLHVHTTLFTYMNCINKMSLVVWRFTKSQEVKTTPLTQRLEHF